MKLPEQDILRQAALTLLDCLQLLVTWRHERSQTSDH